MSERTKWSPDADIESKPIVVGIYSKKQGRYIEIDLGKRADRQRIIALLATEKGLKALESANKAAMQAEAEMLQISDCVTMEIVLPAQTGVLGG